MARSPVQRRKAQDRLSAARGRMVKITGPSGRLYWPGLYQAVPNEHRRLVRALLDEIRSPLVSSSETVV